MADASNPFQYRDIAIAVSLLLGWLNYRRFSKARTADIRGDAFERDACEPLRDMLQKIDQQALELRLAVSISDEDDRAESVKKINNDFGTLFFSLELCIDEAKSHRDRVWVLHAIEELEISDVILRKFDDLQAEGVSNLEQKEIAKNIGRDLSEYGKKWRQCMSRELETIRSVK